MPILDLFYPKHCPVCLTALPPGKTLICSECRKKIRLIEEPVCCKCGRPVRDETREFCASCERSMPHFERNIIWADYSSFYIRRMLSEVKYHENRQLLDYPCLDFSERHRSEILSFGAEVLIPVPVHEKRLRERGYNQAEEIAKRLSASLGIPLDSGCLIRKASTAAQKNLGRRERALNLLSAFEAEDGAKKYKSVILVDDIYTTGATLNSCTRVLKNAGVGKVFALTLSAGRV